MSEGIVFHQGVKQLSLNIEVINNSANFPDESEEYFKRHGKKHEFLRHFMEDVTKFEENVLENTREYYDRSTLEIAEYLKIVENEENIQSSSVFSPLESFASLRTALVQCNFTDINRLISDLNDQLDMEDEKNDWITDRIIISEKDPIPCVIDKISKSNADRIILIAQQFESLRPQYLDSIISLIFSKKSISTKISTIRLVVCISTSPAFFKTTCSTDSLHLLKLKEFDCLRLDEIFQKFIETDISPAIYSGEFINYLRDRFFSCDYSISSLIKAVQFSFLQKYIEQPLWRQNNRNSDDLNKYNTLFSVFTEKFVKNRMDQLKIHASIQCDKDFWKNREDSIFLYWRRKFFDSSDDEIQQILVEIATQMANFDKSWVEKVTEIKKLFEENKEEKGAEPKSSTTPGKKATKSTFLELKRQQEARMAASQNNVKRKIREMTYEHVMERFESILQPYPSTWSNVIGKYYENGELTKIGLEANDEFEIEKCLLEDVKYAETPISIAWRSLLSHKNFKQVPLADWAQEFGKHYKGPKKEAKEAFFGSIGQLEHMGLIKGGAADRKSTMVQVLYHPISHVAMI